MEGKMECNLFGRIFFLPQKIDMGEILKFSFTTVLLCQGHIDRAMQKTPIRWLVKELEVRVISEALLNIDTPVIDNI